MFNTTTVPTTQFDDMLDAEISLHEFPDGTARNPLACAIPPEPNGMNEADLRANLSR